ncbi:MAG: hypothetical protein HY744_33910 [Deltaproteobacteria bacterium]|nr:hypothetical protein [Deltaproteobacteria bacterium]
MTMTTCVLGACRYRAVLCFGLLLPAGCADHEPSAPGAPPAEPHRAGFARADVQLPRLAAGAVRVADVRSGLALEFALEGAREVPAREERGGLVLFAKAAPDGGDLWLRAHDRGVEDWIAIEQRPARAELRYRVALAGVAGLRLVANTLELLDSGGAPRLRVAPPYLVDAAGELHQARIEVRGCALDRNPAAPWDRAPTAPGAPICELRLDWQGVSVVYPAWVDPQWVTTGSMSAGRAGPDMVTLADGRVLVAGGTGPGGVGKTAELWDPKSESWASTGELGQSRPSPVLAVLPAPVGQVLVTGGAGSSAERYDPLAGTWKPTPPMKAARERPTATVLADGRVLVAGATDEKTRSELYDPVADQWKPVPGADMGQARTGHTASLLSDGRVLVAGGLPSGEGKAVATAEIFDPQSGGWKPAAPMVEARVRHGAVTLGTGQVLVAGGSSCDGVCQTAASAELYLADEDTWVPTGGLSQSRQDHSTSLLGNGRVLVTGGQSCDLLSCVMLQTAEMYDPAGNWTTIKPMSQHRTQHAASVVGSRVLVAGGQGCTQYQCIIHSSAELFALAQGGAACALAGECASGFCADGVCCDQACTEPCHGCTAKVKGSGADGACGAVPAGPDPRGLCTDQGPQSCGTTGICAAGGACAPYGEGTECAPAECTPELHTTSACDGQGVCVAAAESCAPFAFDCAKGACKQSCAGDADCVADSRCETATGACVTGASCDGDHTATTAGGQSIDCTPFKCAADGTCRTTCSTSDDCVGDSVCDRDHRCVHRPETTPAGEESASCGCRLPAGAGTPRWAAGLALAALLARRRRRRCRRGRVVVRS